MKVDSKSRVYKEKGKDNNIFIPPGFINAKAIYSSLRPHSSIELICVSLKATGYTMAQEHIFISFIRGLYCKQQNSEV